MASSGIKLAPSSPIVSHLIFIDGIISFMKAFIEEATWVRDSMHTYYNASGQQVNLSKSSVYFDKGCQENNRHAIKPILEVEKDSLNKKYLGLPANVGRQKNGVFVYLKDRVWKGVHGWMEQT